MNKINIMYLIESLTSGGAQRQLVELAKNINKERYRVFIVIYHDIIHYEYILKSKGVEVICIEKRYKFSPIFIWRLVRFIRKNKIDIIHSYMHNTNVWGRLAGKISGCKIVIPSIRTINLSKWYYLIERLLSKWTTVVITNSHTARNEYLRHVNVPSDDFVRVIPNGIDIDTIEGRKMTSSAEIKTRYNINSDDFVIVQVAGIDRNKNQLCLLKAVKQIEANSLKVLLVGSIREASYYEELMNYVEKRHLGNIVLFLGEQQDVFSILNIANLFVLTSLIEGFPNVIMEAMVMGLPIISSNVGDVTYLVKSGKNGYLFQKDRYEELADLLKKMIEMNQTQRSNMGTLSRQIIEDYTIKNMVEMTEEIYENSLTILSETRK